MTRSGGVCRYVMAVCCCSWSGRIAATADCPACGRNWKARISPERCKILDALEERPTAEMVPTMRDRFVELGLIKAASPKRPPGGNGRHRPPPRAYALTEQGRNARDAYRAMEADLRERAEIAGMTAARHADIPAAQVRPELNLVCSSPAPAIRTGGSR